MKYTAGFFIIFFCCFTCHAQDIKIYPSNWWAGMKYSNVQLMVHGPAIGNAKVSAVYPGVTIKKIHRPENANYLFIDLNIGSNAKAGTIQLRIGNDLYPFELKSRRRSENGKSRIRGISSKDLVYLIMPDRFSNGDPTNDRIPGMRELVYGRDSLKGRHGGDLQGINNHLDFIKDLGVTAIWLNPVLKNDRVRESFHGYAFTDHYTIDPRLGGDNEYMRLIENAHMKGIGIIQDAVYNHVDIEHITVRDMPMKSWLNNWDKFQNTTYKDQTLMDPYASSHDRKIMTDGWFSRNMPDLNQRNPFVANFLIQHAIWTTEYFGIDGWRIDTYAYCDLEFMNRCNKALLDEYPQLGIFGETWVHGMTNQGFFMQNNVTGIFKSNLPGVTDFQLYYAMNDALTKGYGWTDGVSKMNLTLAGDYIYKDPYKNSVFLDNHDLTRFFTHVNESLPKYKMGINWLMTLRGIPQLYYGTEILMTGSTHPTDALVRKDFPGGWAGDTTNKFTASGRTTQENEAFNYVKALANFRKTSSALTTGKMMQFVPFDGLYVYFRYDADQTVMVISNTNDKSMDVKMKIYTERIAGFRQMKNIATGVVQPVSDFTIEPWGSGVYKLLR